LRLAGHPTAARGQPVPLAGAEVLEGMAMPRLGQASAAGKLQPDLRQSRLHVLEGN